MAVSVNKVAPCLCWKHLFVGDYDATSILLYFHVTCSTGFATGRLVLLSECVKELGGQPGTEGQELRICHSEWRGCPFILKEMQKDGQKDGKLPMDGSSLIAPRSAAAEWGFKDGSEERKKAGTKGSTWLEGEMIIKEQFKERKIWKLESILVFIVPFPKYGKSRESHVTFRSCFKSTFTIA